MADEFNGFPVECFKFYRELETNNSKQWFEQHRADYEEHVLGPARRFVTAMGDKLARLCPGIHAEPMVDRSIFRIYISGRLKPTLPCGSGRGAASGWNHPVFISILSLLRSCWVSECISSRKNF